MTDFEDKQVANNETMEDAAFKKSVLAILLKAKF